MPSIDSLKTRRELAVGDKTYVYYSLRAAEEAVGEGARGKVAVAVGRVVVERGAQLVQLRARGPARDRRTVQAPLVLRPRNGPGSRRAAVLPRGRPRTQPPGRGRPSVGP